MEKIIKEKVFNDLMKKLGINKAETEAEKFNEWMKTKVQSVHYANTKAMNNAYNRLT